MGTLLFYVYFMKTYIWIKFQLSCCWNWKYFVPFRQMF